MAVIYTSVDLGAALRHARKQLKLTQPQLALVANVGVRFLVELEAGKPTIQLNGVLRVIQALGSELTLTMHPSLESDNND